MQTYQSITVSTPLLLFRFYDMNSVDMNNTQNAVG